MHTIANIKGFSVIVPVQEEEAERENEQDKENVNPVAGLILNRLSYCFISLLCIFSRIHSLSMHHVQDISLFQYLLSEDSLQLSHFDHLALHLLYLAGEAAQLFNKPLILHLHGLLLLH